MARRSERILGIEGPPFPNAADRVSPPHQAGLAHLPGEVELFEDEEGEGHSSESDSGGSDGFVVINDEMANEQAEARREIESILRKIRGLRERGTALLVAIRGHHDAYNADPPNPPPANYQQEQAERLFQMEEHLKRVESIMDWSRRTDLTFHDRLVDANYDPADRDQRVQRFNDDTELLNDSYLHNGKAVEKFLTERKLQRKAVTDEAARKNKLPELETTKFYGEKEKYLNFRHDFRTVTEKGERPKEACLMHLRSKLVGKAKNVIADVPATAAGYEEAWRILDQRYGDEEQIKQILIGKFKGARKLDNEQDFDKLRRHHDYIKGMYANLQELWPNAAEYQMVLYPDIISSYPMATLVEVERVLPVRNTNIQLFLDEVERHLLNMDRRRTLVNRAAVAAGKEKPEAESKNKKDVKKKGGTAYNFANVKEPMNKSQANRRRPKESAKDRNNPNSGRGGGGGNGGQKHAHGPNSGGASNQGDKKKDIDNSNKGGQKRCPMCKGDHWLSDCKEFKLMSAVEREKKVKTLELCLRCFSAKHFSRECKADITCKAKQGGNGGVCGLKHHTLLHRGKSQ